MSDRDREIDRLTEVFKDAILHAPIPDVNPNLIRTVESQARECALAAMRARARALRQAAEEIAGGERWWLRFRADQLEGEVL